MIKKAIKTITVLTICLIVGTSLLGGECRAETKLSKPILTKDKTIVQSKKAAFKSKGILTFPKGLVSEEAGSVMYYSLNGKDPKEYGKPYKGDIALPIGYKSETCLQAINTKEGYLNSDCTEQKYRRMDVYTKALKNRKVTMKRNCKTISGKVYTSSLIKKYKLTRYVTIKIKKKSGKIEQYKVKVKTNNKWAKRLNSKMKKGDRLYISATTSDCVIKFKKADQTTGVIGVAAYAPKWTTTKYQFKDGKLCSVPSRLKNITVKVTASKKSVKLKVSNKGKKDFKFGFGFKLYKKVGSYWEKVDFKEDAVFPKTLYIVKGHRSMVEDIVWRNYFDKDLSKGEYKIIWVKAKNFKI